MSSFTEPMVNTEILNPVESINSVPLNRNQTKQDSVSFHDDTDMFVLKRNGKMEIMSFDKIMKRIKKCGEDVGIHLNYASLAMKVIDQLYNRIPTTQIDELTAEQCYSMSCIHPDYAVLASRIIHSNHHGNTLDSFSATMTLLYRYIDKNGVSCPLISEALYKIVKKNKKELDAMCDYSRDYLIDYFGFKTLEKSYLMSINRKVVERIQHMWLRVSLGIHGQNMERVQETYFYMSQKYFIHATPTLFNSGTPHPQLSSCFLLGMESDSIEGIFNTLGDCARISKWGGGIGLHIHNVRAKGSHIRGTNGCSNGIVPMLRVFNNTAKYVDQCVVPETVIYTTQGPQRIEACQSGFTRVFGATGEAEVIENVLEHNYEGELLEIHTEFEHKPLKITPEHPISVLPYYTPSVLTPDNVKSHLKWMEAGKIQVGDWLVYNIPTFYNDISSITEDDCYIAGLIIGSGSLYNYNMNMDFFSLNNGSISDLTTGEQVENFIKQYFEERMVSFKIYSSFIYWRREVHLPFRYSDFYDQHGTKRLSGKWLNLPVSKSKYILKGIIHSCGGTFNQGKITLKTSIFESIAEDIRFLCLKQGILTETVKNETTMGGRVSFHLTFELNKLFDLDLELLTDEEPEKRRIGDYLLSRVTSIILSEYNGVLYDLQMTNEHNYLLHNGLVHNGGGKRNGSFAIYLETWHADIEMFLQMKKNHGEEELKARDLFYALWISDLFMERMHSNGKWTLMCPDECPGLSEVWGDDFRTLYEKYEKEGKGRKEMNARDLWIQILDAQMETGTPYLLYKDSANRKSNQQNLGTIKSSNLCCEVIQYSSSEESAVCNLSSIALPSFLVKDQDNNYVFDYEQLHKVASIVTYNLNSVIDNSYYPTQKSKKSNMKTRPIGIGVQGLADLFMMLGLPFDSNEARLINRRIFETIYHGALEQSCLMAKENAPYESFQGSPASKGILQFDMWNVVPEFGRYDWNKMKQDIQEYGLRNSLLLAPMPTASTSQILGFNECFEPITSNIYSRGTIAGQFLLANKYLMRDLINHGLWNENVKKNIIANNGSIQQIELIPPEIRQIYRTVWEIPMKSLIDMSAERGAYICQSQSLNLWVEDPNYKTLTAMHYYGWKQGLKTGIYYLRRRGKHQAQKFTIEPELLGTGQRTRSSSIVDDEDNNICEMCSA